MTSIRNHLNHESQFHKTLHFNLFTKLGLKHFMNIVSVHPQELN